MPNYKTNHKIERKFQAIGKFLCDARHRKNLTQRQVSLALGYSSAQFISNFERGIAVPPLARLRTMVRIYGIDPSELIELTIESGRMILSNELLGKASNKRR